MKPSLAWALTVALSYFPVVHAAPSATARIEINYLLGYVEQSGCRFYRNGTWYDAGQAQAHLRQKYDYLAARNRIGTAEDFIELAATKSSMSGKAYAIECNGGPIEPANQWLREALARYRTSGRSTPADDTPRPTGLRQARGLGGASQRQSYCAVARIETGNGQRSRNMCFLKT